MVKVRAELHPRPLQPERPLVATLARPVEKTYAMAPVSDSVPLRVLKLYILVRDGSKTTFMRSAAYTLRLRAPPPQWAWGKDVGEGKFYDYNDAESEAIWCYSSSYEGKPQ